MTLNVKLNAKNHLYANAMIASSKYVLTLAKIFATTRNHAVVHAEILKAVMMKYVHQIHAMVSNIAIH